MASNQIPDINLRNTIQAIERKFDKLNSISQVPKDTSLSELIDVVNRIISKEKKR
jgi:Tfp pilus assembly protein PilO